jgi:hypothetical protein
MKVWQYITGGLVAAVIIVQFIPNELPAVETSNPGDIIQSGIVADDVAVLLKKSCYSCHSNETNYPWYSYVAPSSWLVAKDVREGRDELNFSTWTSYAMMDKLAKLDDLVEEVKEGEMPMEIYTLIHPSAKLDEAQRQLIISWAEATMDVVAEEEDIEE